MYIYIYEIMYMYMIVYVYIYIYLNSILQYYITIVKYDSNNKPNNSKYHNNNNQCCSNLVCILIVIQCNILCAHTHTHTRTISEVFSCQLDHRMIWPHAFEERMFSCTHEFKIHRRSRYFLATSLVSCLTWHGAK